MEDLLSLETDLGCTVDQLRFVGGHMLVRKLRVPDTSSGEFGRRIHLPGVFVRRSVKNLTLIKAEIIRESEPWLSRHTGKRVVGLDTKTGRWVYKYPTKPGVIVPPVARIGEGILYNGYNVGAVRVYGLEEPLVIVRAIDIEAVFPMACVHEIQIGDFALSRRAEDTSAAVA